MLENRPIIKIKKSIFEVILNITALLFFSGIVLYLWAQWSSIPNEVPMHFNFAGEPDNWGHKGVLWAPLIIGLSLWIGLTFLEKYPHVYNYPNLTEQNAERQYENASMMINVIKNEMLIIFIVTSWQSVQVAKGEYTRLSVWDMVINLTVIFGTLAFFIIRSFRIK